MIRLSLSQLNTIEAIVRHGHLTRAAAQLHLTQPALSMQVRQASDAVGEPLFTPRGRLLAATEAGLRVAETAREVQAALERLRADLADRRGLKIGRLRIAAATTAEYFIARLLGRFHTRHPGIEINLEVLNRAQVLERFARGAGDLFVMARPPAGADIASLRFLDNPLVAIAPRGHPLAKCKRVSLARLCATGLIGREEGSGTRLILEEFLAARGMRAEQHMTLGSNEAIKQAVSAGFGCAVISRHALAAGKVPLILPVAGFPIRSHWHLVHARGARLSLAAAAFVGFVVEPAASADKMRRSKSNESPAT